MGAKMQKQVLRSKTVGTKLSPLEYEKIEEVVKAGAFLGVSDFVREAVRDKLEELEVVKVKDVDYKTAKKEVLGYFKKYREAYSDEAANDLGLDLELVVNITRELRKEKRLEVAE